MKTATSSRNFFQNVGRLSSPDERFRIIVVGVDVLRDGTGDIAYALKDPATKAVDCEIAEEAFDHVKPRSTSRSEVDVESRIPLEPGFYLFVLMGGIIVADDMDVFSLGNIAADQVEKANPFLVAVLFHAGADNLTAEGIHSGEQRGCAIALVIMSHRLATTLLQRKPRLSPVQSLNLTFLIAGEDQRVLWRVEIETDDVFEFFLKLFVVGKFETGHPMGLQSVRRPDTSYAGCTDSRGFRHGSPAPVGASHRGILERHLHNAGTDRCRNRRNAPRTGLIFENARKPTLSIPVPPPPDLHDIFAQALCDLFVLEAIGSQKDYGRPLLGANRSGPATLHGFQFFTLLHAQNNGRGYSHARKVAETL